MTLERSPFHGFGNNRPMMKPLQTSQQNFTPCRYIGFSTMTCQRYIAIDKRYLYLDHPVCTYVSRLFCLHTIIYIYICISSHLVLKPIHMDVFCFRRYECWLQFRTSQIHIANAFDREIEFVISFSFEKVLFEIMNL